MVILLENPQKNYCCLLWVYLHLLSFQDITLERIIDQRRQSLHP